MAQKDLTSKKMESEPDVFADIFNSLLFKTEDTKIINPEFTLVDEPTEGFWEDYSGRTRNVFGDLKKSYFKDDLRGCLVCLAVENESEIKRTVITKVLGYKFTEIKRQQEIYFNKRTALQELKEKARAEKNYQLEMNYQKELESLGELKFAPFIPIVLNFDNRRWNEPKDLKEMTIDSIYNQFDQSFEIKVYDVRFLTEEERKQFSSDFRIFLEFFCMDGNPADIMNQEVRHPTEVIDMLIAYTKDEKLKKIRNRVAIDELNGKEIKMDGLFSKMIDEAAAIVAEEKVKVLTEEKVTALAEEKANVLAEEKANVLAEEKAKVLAEEKAKVLAEEAVKEAVKEVRYDETIKFAKINFSKKRCSNQEIIIEMAENLNLSFDDAKKVFESDILNDENR